jgi:hypothetical protein
MVVAGRQLWQGQRGLPAAAAAPSGGRPSAAAPAAEAAAAQPRRYRVVSDFRRGWPATLVELAHGDNAGRQAVAEAAAKAGRLQQRPQVYQRRQALPTKSRVRRRPVEQPGVAA